MQERKMKKLLLILTFLSLLIVVVILSKSSLALNFPELNFNGKGALPINQKVNSGGINLNTKGKGVGNSVTMPVEWHIMKWTPNGWVAVETRIYNMTPGEINKIPESNIYGYRDGLAVKRMTTPDGKIVIHTTATDFDPVNPNRIGYHPWDKTGIPPQIIDWVKAGKTLPKDVEDYLNGRRPDITSESMKALGLKDSQVPNLYDFPGSAYKLKESSNSQMK